MNESLHIAETDLTLYAMGALSAEEMAAARAHVEICAHCKAELRQIDLALAAYAQTTPAVELPAGSRERFMARLTDTPQASAASARSVQPARKQEPKISWSKRLFGGRWSVALAGAMALLLVLVSIDDMRRRTEMAPLLAEAQRGHIDSAQLNQLMELLTSSQAKRVALHEAPSATPPPEGRVVYSARNGKLLLTAQNLHPLPAGKVYELWILQPEGKKPLPAGTFAPDSRGNAAMILADEPANLSAQGFAVTIEKEGGSDTPTPPIVLSGQ
jgi:anti-sigma-K factor RskA